MTRGPELLYVELKSGFSDNGPAWIGFGVFSKTGSTIYFNGKVLKRGTGISGNRYDLKTGEEYWVSGVKKRGTNRHPLGGGVISIDRAAVAEYLQITGMKSIPTRMFNVVELVNEPDKEFAYEVENQPFVPKFDDALRFKTPGDLSVDELRTVIAYYEDRDLNSIHKKARRVVKTKLDSLRGELAHRGMKP